MTWPAPSMRLPSQRVLAWRVVLMGSHFRRRQVTLASLARRQASLPVGCRTAVAGRSAEWVVSTFYEEVGGLETFRTIVGRFYEGVATDDGPATLYPRRTSAGGGAVPAVPGAVLGRPDGLLRQARPPAAADAHAPSRSRPRQGALAAALPRGPRARRLTEQRRAVLGLRDPCGAVHGRLLRYEPPRPASDRGTTRVKPRTIRTCVSPLDPCRGRRCARLAAGGVAAAAGHDHCTSRPAAPARPSSTRPGTRSTSTPPSGRRRPRRPTSRARRADDERAHRTTSTVAPVRSTARRAKEHGHAASTGRATRGLRRPLPEARKQAIVDMQAKHAAAHPETGRSEAGFGRSRSYPAGPRAGGRR